MNTDRELAIIEAYTGVKILFGKRRKAYFDYLEEVYGKNRPLYAYELEDEDVLTFLADKIVADFEKLCEKK